MELGAEGSRKCSNPFSHLAQYICAGTLHSLLTSIRITLCYKMSVISVQIVVSYLDPAADGLFRFVWYYLKSDEDWQKSPLKTLN